MEKNKVLSFIFLLALSGCFSTPESYYYLVAKRTDNFETMTSTTVMVRRFEKIKWCEADKENFEKDGEMKAECLHEDQTYAPMFRGEAVGKWYAIRSIGRFSPSLIFYEFDPPLPDGIMLRQLKQMIPHTLQFAAIHEAPAEVRIFSPTGEVR